MLPERFYQAAVAIGLEAKGIRCERGKEFQVFYRGTQVGRYYVDEWIEDGKMLLELRVAPMDTHLSNGEWEGEGDMTVYIDHGQAGSADETIIVENQLSGMFLPLVTRE